MDAYAFVNEQDIKTKRIVLASYLIDENPGIDAHQALSMVADKSDQEITTEYEKRLNKHRDVS